MAGEGLYEAILLAVGPDDPTARPPVRPSVPVLNPLSADHGFLRASLLPGLTRQVEANWANQVRDVRLFEIGTVFSRGGADGRPEEAIQVGAVISGARWPAHWSDGGATPACDRWDLKGLFERTVFSANPPLMHVKGEGGLPFARRPRGRGAGPLPADAPPWAASLFGLEVVIQPDTRAAVR